MRRVIPLLAILFLAIGLAPVRARPPGPEVAAGILQEVLAHLAPGANLEEGLKEARELGLMVGNSYPSIGVFVAYGPAPAVRRLGETESVAYLEKNARVEYLTDTSHLATRGESVLEGEVTLPDGTRIDGTGVGVAVVDTGVDGTHPDLADRMVENLRIYCQEFQVGPIHGPCEFVPLDDTDHPGASGHGTHVAGIVAGTGQASNGRFHGATPGASLYGLGAGAATVITNAMQALDWVLKNHDKVDPPIRVVNGSWHVGSDKPDPANPSALDKMQMELLAAGVSLVFAAGNDGGDGSQHQTSRQCMLPSPGNICVASYNDEDTGTRDGSLSSSSSRGAADDPGTWPDLAAPGVHIISTCRLTLPLCSLGLGHETDPPNHYAEADGTSMAAPHVAGIVALLYQAEPRLRPAEVEWLLEETAHNFSDGAPYEPDPFHPGGTSSYDKGHGLVDARAAVEAVLHPLVVSSPNNEAAIDGSVEVAGQISYGDTVKIAVDGEPVVTLKNIRRYWSGILSGLRPGQRTLTAALFSGGRFVGRVERVVSVS